MNINPPDGREDDPKIQMSLAQIFDGTTKTMMLSENLHSWYWCWGLSSDISATGGQSMMLDTKRLFGFVWKNSRRI